MGMNLTDLATKKIRELVETTDQQGYIPVDSATLGTKKFDIRKLALQTSLNAVNAELSDAIARERTARSNLGNEVAALAGAVIPKGSKTVTQISSLDTTELTEGWMYTLKDSGTISYSLDETTKTLEVSKNDKVVWDDEDGWFVLGRVPDMSEYTKTEGFATVAFSGSFADLLNAPNMAEYTKTEGFASVAFSGQYSDLQGAPTIPTATSDLQNDSGFLTGNDLTLATQSANGLMSATDKTKLDNIFESLMGSCVNAIHLDATSGNDANDGSSASTAVKTLVKALELAYVTKLPIMVDAGGSFNLNGVGASTVLRLDAGITAGVDSDNIVGEFTIIAPYSGITISFADANDNNKKHGFKPLNATSPGGIHVMSLFDMEITNLLELDGSNSFYSKKGHVNFTSNAREAILLGGTFEIQASTASAVYVETGNDVVNVNLIDINVKNGALTLGTSYLYGNKVYIRTGERLQLYNSADHTIKGHMELIVKAAWKIGPSTGSIPHTTFALAASGNLEIHCDASQSDNILIAGINAPFAKVLIDFYNSKSGTYFRSFGNITSRILDVRGEVSWEYPSKSEDLVYSATEAMYINVADFSFTYNKNSKYNYVTIKSPKIFMNVTGGLNLCNVNADVFICKAETAGNVVGQIAPYTRTSANSGKLVRIEADKLTFGPPCLGIAPDPDDSTETATFKRVEIDAAYIKVAYGNIVAHDIYIKANRTGSSANGFIRGLHLYGEYAIQGAYVNIDASSVIYESNNQNAGVEVGLGCSKYLSRYNWSDVPSGILTSLEVKAVCLYVVDPIDSSTTPPQMTSVFKLKPGAVGQKSGQFAHFDIGFVNTAPNNGVTFSLAKFVHTGSVMFYGEVSGKVGSLSAMSVTGSGSSTFKEKNWHNDYDYLFDIDEVKSGDTGRVTLHFEHIGTHDIYVSTDNLSAFEYNDGISESTPVNTTTGLIRALKKNDSASFVRIHVIRGSSGGTNLDLAPFFDSSITSTPFYLEIMGDYALDITILRPVSDSLTYMYIHDFRNVTFSGPASDENATAAGSSFGMGMYVNNIMDSLAINGFTESGVARLANFFVDVDASVTISRMYGNYTYIRSKKNLYFQDVDFASRGQLAKIILRGEESVYFYPIDEFNSVQSIGCVSIEAAQMNFCLKKSKLDHTELDIRVSNHANIDVPFLMQDSIISVTSLTQAAVFAPLLSNYSSSEQENNTGSIRVSAAEGINLYYYNNQNSSVPAAQRIPVIGNKISCFFETNSRILLDSEEYAEFRFVDNGKDGRSSLKGTKLFGCRGDHYVNNVMTDYHEFAPIGKVSFAGNYSLDFDRVEYAYVVLKPTSGAYKTKVSLNTHVLEDEAAVVFDNTTDSGAKVDFFFNIGAVLTADKWIYEASSSPAYASSTGGYGNDFTVSGVVNYCKNNAAIVRAPSSIPSNGVWNVTYTDRDKPVAGAGVSITESNSGRVFSSVPASASVAATISSSDASVSIDNNKYTMITGLTSAVTSLTVTVPETSAGVLQEAAFEFTVPTGASMTTLTAKIGAATCPIIGWDATEAVAGSTVVGVIANGRCTVGIYAAS